MRARGLWLLALLPALASCPSEVESASDKNAKQAEDDTSSVAKSEEASWVCPPCGMSMSSDSELTEVAGHQWAFCNPRCADLVSRSPETFLKHAVSKVEAAGE
ncbi:MAG: hypothetical protein ACI841_000491 [Planctomycetota bacterium]